MSQKMITIRCICNNVYNSLIGNKRTPFNSKLTNESRFHECPKCKHVWDLRPDLPKK